jgi:prepilin-type N-terminal cleavage/methylation domain-containing protein
MIRRADGFTMVELIVALVLTAVIGATTMSMLQSMRSSTSTIRTQSRSTAEARQLSRMLSYDLQRMRAPLRSTDTRTIASELTGPAGYRDITHASASQLRFWADVLPVEGTEYVVWKTRPGTRRGPAGSWSLVRSVYSLDPTDPHAHPHLLTSEELTTWRRRPPADRSDGCPAKGPLDDRRIFCLRTMEDDADRTTACTLSWEGPWNRQLLEDEPTAWNDPQMSHGQLNRIVQVALVGSVAPSWRRGSTSGGHVSWIDIGNRMTPAYQAAIGCAAL